MALPPKPVVLVTGCTTGGIGWHVAAALAERGATVYASARRTAAMEGLPERGCRLLQLDVTKGDSIRDGVAQVMREAGHIDGACGGGHRDGRGRGGGGWAGRRVRQAGGTWVLYDCRLVGMRGGVA
jgi:hypothetical protein